MATKAALSEFISKVKTEGLLTGTHYFIRFGRENSRDVMMMCDSFNLPGLSNSTTDVRIFGENREVPYMPLYPSLDLSFILDRKMAIKSFFDAWSNEVINQNTRNVGYYKDYASTDLDLIITDKEGKAIYCVRVYEAYPKAIQDIRFGFDVKDIIRLNVTLAFKYWERIDVDENGNENANAATPTMSGSLLEQFKSKGLVIPTEPFGSFLGGGFQSTISNLSGNFSKDAMSIGGLFGAEASRSCSGAFALLGSAPGGNFLTQGLGSSIMSLGQSANSFGSALGQLGEGIRNITAPISALSNSVVGISSTLGSINAATSALGLGTPFASVQSKLNSLGGSLATVSNVAGIPGHLTSIGANLSGVGSVFSDLTRSVGSIPGGTQQISDSFANIGKVFSGRGSDVGNVGSVLQQGINTGFYP